MRYLLALLLCAPLIADEKPACSLDDYLKGRGFHLWHGGPSEGYISDPQKQQFNERLAASSIESVFEIGLNGGHSAENFFQSCPGLKKLVSVDINHYPYTATAADYFKLIYGARFEFIAGDSTDRVYEYARAHPDQKFDLIYIDGSQSFDTCLKDILNCKALASEKSIVWVDDYNNPEVFRAAKLCEEIGLIKIVSAHNSYDPAALARCWIEISYL